MIDGMVDIETLGKEPGCVILSIGAVQFDPKQPGIMGNTFYRNVELSSSLMAGFEFDKDTVNWWKKQDHRAAVQLGSEKHNIEDALFDFIDWWNGNNLEKIWSQGATFDPPIIEHALKKFDISIPWKFYNVRDTRTAYDLCGFDQYSLKREGTYHNALDDAIHQVKCVQTAIMQHGS